MPSLRAMPLAGCGFTRQRAATSVTEKGNRRHAIAEGTRIDWIPGFVRENLGCTCPDEVFRAIELEPRFHVPGCGVPLVRILVGERLLIYLMRDANPQAVTRDLPRIVAAGLEERDRRGYNRLRVVLDCCRPEVLMQPARRLFEALPGRDDRAHLHVLHARAVNVAT